MRQPAAGWCISTKDQAPCSSKVRPCVRPVQVVGREKYTRLPTWLKSWAASKCAARSVNTSSLECARNPLPHSDAARAPQNRKGGKFSMMHKPALAKTLGCWLAGSVLMKETRSCTGLRMAELGWPSAQAQLAARTSAKEHQRFKIRIRGNSHSLSVWSRRVGAAGL